MVTHGDMELSRRRTSSDLEINSGGHAEVSLGHTNNAFEGDQSHFPTQNHLQPVKEDDDSDDEDYGLLTCLPDCCSFTNKTQMSKNGWRMAVSLAVGAVYAGYVVAVMSIVTDTEDSNYWCDSDGLVVILTSLLILGLFYFLIVKEFYGSKINRQVLEPLDKKMDKILAIRWVPWVVGLVLLGGALTFVVIDARDDLQRLQSLIGLVVLVLFGFLFSHAPRKIRWRHVAWGMGIQFVLGLLILRWPVGQAVFQCAADKVATFLAFTDEGSRFVFGDCLVLDLELFAFKVLPVILFFSFCIQILYYLGVMQWVVIKLGWCLQVTVGTTACESVNAAANIFLGQTEAPLLVKPFITDMTKSELHAVMTGGFATIAGSVLAAYISFGVDPANLITASVMNAPAALAFSKLFYPETKQSKTKVDNIRVEKGEEANLLHAAMVGVTNAIPLVANIAANLIAFIAFIALCSHVIDWACTLLGADPGQITLESIFGWLFMPLAWVLGVQWSECDEVGELIGTKIIVNEFVAYSRLSEMMEAGMLSPRAEMIATYALCGFSNISSIGINLGGFSAMAPSRRGDLAKVVVRAMIAGSCATFLTTCIAGTLVDATAESTTFQSFRGSLRNLPCQEHFT